jgi:hypothetical protein
MDPLSATASVIAILQLSPKVVKCINSSAGATKERKRLREELRACESILQQLKDEADDSEEGKAWSETIEALEAPEAPLGRLWVALCRIEAKLQPKEGMKMALENLKWPFNEKEIKEIFGTIEREKSLLELALTKNSRKLIQEIQRTSNENKRQLMELTQAVKRDSKESEGQFSGLKDDLALLQSSQAGLQHGLDGLYLRNDNRDLLEERQTILGWLTLIDYAAQQSDYIKRRQPGTGQWFLNSLEFQTWLQADKQTLFCPGIPGAGKTILTAIVIDHLTYQYGNDPSIGIAYIYCNYRRKEEQRLDGLLGNLLKQLSEARPSMPNTVKELYEQYKSKRARPSTDELLRSLQSVVGSYSKVFVVIDALDGCQVSEGCRARFIEECFALQVRCGTNVFMTSRFLPKITEKFDKASTFEIRASPEDVQKYLAGQMFRLPGFVNRDMSLQEEIKSEVVKDINGM